MQAVTEAPQQSAELTALLRDGYVVVRGALEPSVIDAANAELDQFKVLNRRSVQANLDDAGRLWRVVNLHGVLDSFASLFSRSDALRVCDDFFGDEAVLYTSLLFERGSEQARHRDSPAVATRPGRKYLGTWAALEDVDSDNGPLVVVPGSHLLPELDIDAMAVELYGDPANAPEHDDAGWKMYQAASRDQAAAAGLTPTEVHVNRGDVIIWHPHMVHGGAPHNSPTRSRRSLVMHVTPPNTPVYGQNMFFNLREPLPETAPRDYLEHHGRRIERVHNVDFAHVYTKRLGELIRPGAGLGERIGVAARQTRRGLRKAIAR